MPVKVRESGQWVEVSGNSDGGFVTGMIMMFSGTTAPSGWVLCDNSTEAQAANAPDLRDRFIVGTGNSYNLNATGGSANAVLLSHEHTTENFVARSNYAEPRNFGVGTDGNLNNAGDTNNIGIDESGTTKTDGSVTGTNKNLPPYYALAFIMKT